MRRKTSLMTIITALLIVSIVPYTCLAYSGGTGELNTPYQIANKDDLLALAANTGDYGKCFILTADIDMQGQVFAKAIIAAKDTSSSHFFQGTAFTGTFDGNGHKITHFNINGGDCLGLFGCINTGGSVKNLGLENCSVSSSSGSYYVGGLVGYNKGTINDCYSTGAVSGYLFVGGLVGQNNDGSISNCYSTGNVTGGNGSEDIGGLVGSNYQGSLTDCYATGSVSGKGIYTGGLVGQNSGTIQQQRNYQQL